MGAGQFHYVGGEISAGMGIHECAYYMQITKRGLKVL